MGTFIGGGGETGEAFVYIGADAAGNCCCIGTAAIMWCCSCGYIRGVMGGAVAVGVIGCWYIIGCW
jgi:hypothetical protein